MLSQEINVSLTGWLRRGRERDTQTEKKKRKKGKSKRERQSGRKKEAYTQQLRRWQAGEERRRGREESVTV